jgi:hypothetical protein
MIREIEWSTHASERLDEWGLNEYEVGESVRRWNRHRKPDDRGPGDWQVVVPVSGGRDQIVVIYDHPAWDDPRLVRVVTVWVR